MDNTTLPQEPIHLEIKNIKRKRSEIEEIILAAVDEDSKDKVNIYLDSGATCHIFRDKKLLSNIKHSKCNVKGVNGKVSNTNQTGDLRIKAQKTSSKNKFLKLTNVRIMSEASFNLLSVSKLTEKGCKVVFSKNKAEVFQNGQKILHAQQDETNLYKVICIPSFSQITSTKQALISIQELHEKLGHLSEGQCKKLINNKMIEGLKVNKGSKFTKCIACAKVNKKGKNTPKMYH